MDTTIEKKYRLLIILMKSAFIGLMAYSLFKSNV